MVYAHAKSASVLIALFAAALCGGPADAAGSPVAKRETAVAPEVNPPGDIPDDQVFVTYRSAAGFSIKVPEGWARAERANGVSFVDKYGSLDLAIDRRSAEPTLKSVKTTEIPAILAAGHAAEIGKASRLSVPAGKAIAVDYLSNSDSNSVTNRTIRLENRRLYYFAKGRQAAVTLSAPAGADNADQWKLIAESFRWTK